MRAGKAIGLALGVLVAAAVATIWLTPAVSAAGQGGAGRGESGGPAVMTHSIQAAPMIAALAAGRASASRSAT